MCGKLSSTFRAVKTVYDKIQTGERWYDEQVAEPMLGELEAVEGRSFPGEYASRHSQWEEAVSVAAQRKADKAIQEAAEDYVEALEDVENLEEKRLNTAEYFIENLPGGEINGQEVLIVTEVRQVQGTYGPAEPRPEKGSFDIWVKEAWPAFEESDSQSELRRQLESVSTNTHTDLDPDVFRCWEDQLRCDDWPETFWSVYDNEYLERYLQTIRRLSAAREDTEMFANELDAIIETKI